MNIHPEEATLDRMIHLGIDATTWQALSLVPLVEVAWASGQIEDKERRAVMAAAEANGVVPGAASHALLEDWLKSRPDPRLLETWSGYVSELCGNITAQEREGLHRELMSRARHVAEATGGFLGFGNRVSPEEEAVIAELEKAFA